MSHQYDMKVCSRDIYQRRKTCIKSGRAYSRPTHRTYTVTNPPKNACTSKSKRNKRSCFTSYESIHIAQWHGREKIFRKNKEIHKTG